MNKIVIGDNLSVMRSMESDSVDLIYLDPPFNSKKSYSAPIGSKAAGAAFKDTWTLDDVDHAWLGEIAETSDGLYTAIQAAGYLQGNGTMAYLVYMAVRLLEMKRLLRDTGSIYLHCDPTASHYLKLLMDGVFGAGNFRNEIVWKRMSGAKKTTKMFFRDHDTVFFYTQSPKSEWKPEFRPLTKQEIEESWFRYQDENGRIYKADNLNAPGKGGHRYEFLGAIRNWRYKKDRMEALLHEGHIHHKSCTSGAGNTVAVRKRYLDEMEGKTVGCVWTDIQPLNRNNKERIGYPTQKPLALLERIIKASSNEGDLVFDPFCGCATTCVAADKLNRRWIGVDISPKAGEIIDQRMKKELGIFKANYEIKTVDGNIDPAAIEAAKSKRRNRKYNAPENKRELFGEQSGRCAACGYESRYRQFHVDHIISQKRNGSDALDNLQLLCSNCNAVKGGDRSQQELLNRLVEMKVLTADEAAKCAKAMKAAIG